MAILAAALVPTLIGYIKQTRQSNAKNEAAAVVSAAQTVASSAFASGDGKYYDQSNSGAAIEVVTGSTEVDGSATDPARKAIAKLAEVYATKDGLVYAIEFDDGVVKKVEYSSGGTYVTYNATNGKGTYTISSSGFNGTGVNGAS